ncbi:MAG TPA: ABC transporter permease [Anaerolineales bacterium]|nr:ABC transporter permease [Anaerolineales bacterium]
MINQTMPLFRASWKMMLRSRGVIFAVLAAAVPVVVLGLMRDLGFGFGDQTLNFFDYILPGFAVFLVVYQLQDIMVAVAASYKARGILRRLAVTPVSPQLLVVAQMLSFVVLGVLAAFVILALGKLIGADLVITANLLWLIPLVALVVLTALAIAFIIAGLTPNPQTAANVGATISFLLFGFTGVVLPIEALPGALRDIVPYAVPYTALIRAIRGIVLTGEGITAYGQQVRVGLVWLVVAFTVAGISYRFTDE